MVNWSNVNVQDGEGVKVTSHEREEDRNPETYIARARAFILEKQYAAAEKECIKAYELSNKSESYYKILMDFYARRNNPKGYKMKKDYIWNKWSSVIWFGIAVLFFLSYELYNDDLYSRNSESVAYLLLPLLVLGTAWFLSYGRIGKSILFKVAFFPFIIFCYLAVGEFLESQPIITQMVGYCYVIVAVVLGVVFFIDVTRTIRHSEYKFVVFIVKILRIIYILMLVYFIAEFVDSIESVESIESIESTPLIRVIVGIFWLIFIIWLIKWIYNKKKMKKRVKDENGAGQIKIGWLVLGIIFFILAISTLPATLGVSVFFFGYPAKLCIGKAFK
jgi:hypothetical protein